MGTTFISRGCINWCHCKGSQEFKELPQASQSCALALKKLDGVASWLLNGVATVFFSSLERCACINIDTKDDSDIDSNQNLPLILYDGCGSDSAAKCEQETVEIDNKVVVKYI